MDCLLDGIYTAKGQSRNVPLVKKQETLDSVKHS